MRVAVALVMLAACGRLGFDARTDPTGDGAANGDGTQQQQGDGGGGGGSGSGTLVQQSPVAVGTGTVTVVLPNPTQSGDLLVAVIGANNISNLVMPTGWQLNVNGSATGSCTSAIATASNVTGGQTSLVFTFNAGVPADVEVSEWSGVGAIDAAGFGAATNPTTALTVTTLTADQAAGDLAIATFCEDANAPTFALQAGWASLGQFANTASSPSLVGEYQRGQPAGKVTATATGSVSTKYAGTIITFQAP